MNNCIRDYVIQTTNAHAIFTYFPFTVIQKNKLYITIRNFKFSLVFFLNLGKIFVTLLPKETTITDEDREDITKLHHQNQPR